jgi:hypothetical protein
VRLSHVIEILIYRILIKRYIILHREIRQRETMCKIMNGDASLVLKSLVEVCGWGSDLQDQCSLFGLLSASHLTYLLAQSGVAAASSISTSPSNNQDPNFSRDLPSGAEVLGELLGGGRIGRSLSATLPEESSFVEELLLESAQRLNKLQFPLDVSPCCSLPVAQLC